MSEIQWNIIHLSKKGPISKPPFITGESNVISSSQSDDRKDINCHNKFDFLKSFLIMEIEDNTTVILHYSSNKIPLHVHMMITDIEEGEKNCTITHSYTLFIIFHNRIVKINLENTESGCVFRNCIIDNSFMILSNLFKTSIKSFFKEISNTRLISCIVQNQTCYIKEIVLVDDDDEHLFYTGVQFSFELPSSFTFLNYNDQHWYGNCIGIDGKLDGMENPLQINIYYASIMVLLISRIRSFAMDILRTISRKLLGSNMLISILIIKAILQKRERKFYNLWKSCSLSQS